MNFMQITMLVCATSLLLTTGVLLIIRTMPSRDGIGWWIMSTAIQVVLYSLGVLAMGQEESVAGTLIFIVLSLLIIESICIGMLQYIDESTNAPIRFTLLGVISLLVASMLIEGYKDYALYIFVCYLAANALATAIVICRSKESMLWLKIAAAFLFACGLHWLDFPILSKVEWFAPIGFLLGLFLSMGLYLSLTTVALLQFKKITKDSEQRAIRAAIHDPLTDLYNRSHLDALYEKHKRAVDEGNGSFLLLYIDLDGFKQVNDTYGHKAGDVILIVIAKRLKQWLGKKGDAVRIGGDELVVINSLRSDANSAIVYGTSAAQTVLSLLEQPIIDGDCIYNISGSIGGCYYDPDHSCLEDMLTKADKLMYQAKNTGGKRVVFENAPKGTTPLSIVKPQDVTSPEDPDSIAAHR